MRNVDEARAWFGTWLIYQHARVRFAELVRGQLDRDMAELTAAWRAAAAELGLSEAITRDMSHPRRRRQKLCRALRLGRFPDQQVREAWTFERNFGLAYALEDDMDAKRWAIVESRTSVPSRI